MLQAAYHVSRVKRPLLQEQAALILSRTITALADAVSYRPAEVSKPDSVDGFFSPSIAPPTRPNRQRVALQPVQAPQQPTASTSKLVETAPITNVNNLISSHRRLLSQLRAVTDIIDTLPAAHLTPPEGLVLLHPHIYKLQARLLASKASDRLPAHALPHLKAGSAQYAAYLLEHMMPHAKSMRPHMLTCAWRTGMSLLELSILQADYVVPEDLLELPLCEGQVKEAMTKKLRYRLHTTGHSLVHASRFEDVLVDLRNLHPHDWHKLNAPSLLRIWRSIKQDIQHIRCLLAEVGQALPGHKLTQQRRNAISRVTKLWTLHTVLHFDPATSLREGSAKGRTTDLADAEVPLYRGLKFMLSQSVLALSQKDPLTSKKVEQVSAMGLDLVGILRKHQYPMDSQIIAAILHLHHLGDANLRSALHDQSVISEAWEQWAPLQAREIRQTSDIVMLVGFLRAVPHPDARTVAFPSLWEQQAMSCAQSALRLNWEESAGAAHSNEPTSNTLLAAQTSATPAKPFHQGIASDLLRALAIASLRLDRIDITFDCLHDSRLKPRHAISVLSELSGYLGPASPIPVPERKQLIAICANFSAKLASHLRTYVEKERVKLLVPLVELLAHHLHLDEAAAMVLSLQNPAHLGEAVLSEFLRKLSFHRQGTSALAIYSKIPPFDVTDYHRAALLSSPWKVLSDMVWEQLFADGKKKQLNVRLLNARLLHYANQPEKTKVSSRRVLLDHSDAINVLGVEPTTETDNILFGILIQAGRLRRAYDVYERLRAAASAHTSTILNTLLMVAPKPRADWRSIGPVAEHNKLVKALKQMTEERDMLVNGVTANILLRSNLKWGEMSRDAVWAALKAGLENAEQRDWTTELRPLFRMVIDFFIERGMKEDARKAVWMMAEMRRSRIGR